ncbi:MAG: serine hydrolase [Firmicutes bacterium]|nr:serine hydrolase [Bacillota bacterium]
MEKEESKVAGEAALPPWVYNKWQRGAGSVSGEKKVFAGLKEELRKVIRVSGLSTKLCLYDYAADGWILLEAHRVFYPASLIKMLLLLTALEKAEKENFSLNERHRLAESDKYAGTTRVAGTGILQFAPAGSAYTFEELLALMMSCSDNVATNILLERMDAEACAAAAQKYGLEKSAFTRKMYDRESEQPSNRATAYELTRMLLALQDRKAASEALTCKGIAMLAAATDKERIGRYIKQRAVVANKVGTVSGMVGDMALLYFPNSPPLALTAAVTNPPGQEEAAALISRLAQIIVEALR